jgi:hypothetical protein
METSITMLSISCTVDYIELAPIATAGDGHRICTRSPRKRWFRADFLVFCEAQSDSEVRVMLAPTWVSFSSMRS